MFAGYHGGGHEYDDGLEVLDIRLGEQPPRLMVHTFVDGQQVDGGMLQ